MNGASVRIPHRRLPAAPVLAATLLVVGTCFSSRPAAAQGCCSPSTTPISALQSGPASPRSVDLGVYYEYYRLRGNLQGTSEVPDPQDRLSQLHIANFAVGYAPLSRVGFRAILPVARRSREQTLSTPTVQRRDELVGSGIGDVSLLAQGRILPLRGIRPFGVSLGAGVKLPTGGNQVQASGVLLPLDLQPGTGATDLLLTSYGQYYGWPGWNLFAGHGLLRCEIRPGPLRDEFHGPRGFRHRPGSLGRTVRSAQGQSPFDATCMVGRDPWSHAGRWPAPPSVVGIEGAPVSDSPMSDHNEESASTALVLCGGGVRGAVEVGFYRALTELGLRFDFIVGTSIGAINGAFIAAGMTPAELGQLWTRARLRSFFKPSASLLWRGTYADSLFSPRGLRRFLEKHLPVRRFEDLRVPLRITATDLDRGEVVVFGPHSGDLLSAVLASCAVPGIYPPVTISGRRLADGGILSNLPLQVAIDAGATRVLAMECVCDDAYSEPAAGFVSQIFRAFHLAGVGRYQEQLARYRDVVELVILEPGPGCQPRVRGSRGVAALADLGYETAVEVLRPPPGPRNARRDP